MKKTLIISASLLFVFSLTAISQEQEKPTFFRNQIGIQFNPNINEQLFQPGGLRNMITVSALRYGYRITRNVTTGLEFSCLYPIHINSGQIYHYFNYFSYNVGLYARYSILTEKRFQIFAEASPLFSHYWREWTSSNDHSPYTINKFGYYIAPGITLYSKRRRVSFDLYYKFSNLSSVNSNNSVLSYKINFNF